MLSARGASAFALPLLALALLAACGGGGGGTYETTPTAAVQSEPTSTPSEPIVPPSEAGEAPLFWRTEDRFASLQAGKGYKVLFRITNGYNAEMLRITAEPEGGGAPLELQANRAQPAGTEEPGSYYPLTLDLPAPGRWQLTVFAGDDEVTIPVEARPKD